MNGDVIFFFSKLGEGLRFLSSPTAGMYQRAFYSPSQLLLALYLSCLPLFFFANFNHRNATRFLFQSSCSLLSTLSYHFKLSFLWMRVELLKRKKKIALSYFFRCDLTGATLISLGICDLSDHFTQSHLQSTIGSRNKYMILSMKAHTLMPRLTSSLTK